MKTQKIFQALSIALLAGLSACNTAPQGSQALVDAPAAKEAAPEARKTISVGQNLVIKNAGGGVMAYSLEADRFLLPNGLVVKVDAWSGALYTSTVSVVWLYYTGAGCSGSAYAVIGYSVVPNEVFNVGSNLYKVTNKVTATVVSQYTASSGCTALGSPSTGKFYEYSAVSASDLPTFSGPIQLEVQ